MSDFSRGFWEGFWRQSARQAALIDILFILPALVLIAVALGAWRVMQERSA